MEHVQTCSIMYDNIRSPSQVTDMDGPITVTLKYAVQSQKVSKTSKQLLYFSLAD